MSVTPFAPASPLIEGFERLRKNWWLLLLFGIGLLLIGTFAIVASFVATLATVVMFGVLLLVGGALQLVGAFSSRGWGGFFLSVLGGLLYLVVGLLMLEHPIAAAAGLTLMIAAGLLIGGALRIVISLTERFPNWGWVLLNGVITLALGVLIWRRWPGDSLDIIGLFVGIELIFCGLAWVMLALALRSRRAA